MPATVDAANLAAMWAKGEIPGCILEGLMTMDVALSGMRLFTKVLTAGLPEKRISLSCRISKREICGKDSDLLRRGKMAGVILGADYTIIMTSARKTPRKLNSIALAAAIAR